MKLLFDQHLSPRLSARLADLFSGSVHVQDVGLDSSPDDELWEYALANGCAIVTKDEDFDALGVVRGWPPKVIWIQLGNCTTTEVEEAIRRNAASIVAFDSDPNAGTLVIR